MVATRVRQHAGVRFAPSAGAMMWGAAGGLVASALIGIPMQQMDLVGGRVAALVGSSGLLVGWFLHLLAGIAAGAAFGAFVRTRSYGLGALLGAAYGLALGIVGAWLATSLMLREGLAIDAIAGLLVGLHLLWGTLVGLAVPWGLRTTGAGERIPVLGA